MKGAGSGVGDCERLAGGMVGASGCLNSFQQAMLLWEEIHPYNAAHAVRLPGLADASGLSSAARRAAGETGIGDLALNREKRSFQYLPLTTISLRELPDTSDADRTLSAVLAEELRSPFPSGPHHPIRWLVFNDSTGDSHFVVLAYHHVASDGLGIQTLLSRVLSYYLGVPDASEARAGEADVAARASPQAFRAGMTQHFRPLVRTAAEYFRLRYAHRMRERKEGGEETAFLARGTGNGLVERLHGACRDRKVGLNDVILAATGSAIADMTSSRREHSRRRKLALSTIVSLRKTIGGRLDTAFGVLLRDRVILLDEPDTEFAGVLRQVTAQTRKLRTDREADQAARLPFVRYLWPLMRIPHTRASYQKLFPICAGVSTITGCESRFGEVAARILRYVRACPPGPAMPMVFAPTVMGGRLEIGLVCRESCLDVNQMGRLLDQVLRRVEEFADVARNPANQEVRMVH